LFSNEQVLFSYTPYFGDGVEPGDALMIAPGEPIPAFCGRILPTAAESGCDLVPIPDMILFYFQILQDPVKTF
jgi:hypothetical protein